MAMNKVADVAELLDNQHILSFSLSVIPPPVLLCRGSILAVRFSCSCILSGSFLPSSARAHLSASAYNSLTSLILHITISSLILRFRTF